MIKKHLSLLFLTISFCPIASAQDMGRIRNCLDTLCAPGMYGRSASFNGQKKAAHYLSDRFSEIGLSPLSNSYFQPFTYSINTFSGAFCLQTDQTLLIPGKDFIVQPNAPSGSAKLKVLFLDTLLFSSKKHQRLFFSTSTKKTAFVYDEYFEKKLKLASKEILAKFKEAAVIVLLREKKLTMGLSCSQGKTIVFEVLKEKFNATTKTISFEIEAALLKNYEAQNVIGCIKGTTQPDSFLFITAHYDHLGTLGANQYFPGANDNGSGVSMLLELARYFKTNPQPYTIVMVAFGAEEAGLIGSNYYTQNPVVPLTKIRFLLNLDLMGTGDDGLMVVNGSVFTKEFELLMSLNKKENYFTTIKKRGKAANSDHYYFSEKGVPAFFFYTLGGISAYHDVFDLPNTLPLTNYKEGYRLIIAFISSLAQ